MKEHLKKMRKCPFCGSDHSDHWTFFGYPSSGEVMLEHFCHPNNQPGLHTTICVYGATEDECVERWNGDVQEHTAN